jgi:hypothetical protein
LQLANQPIETGRLVSLAVARRFKWLMTLPFIRAETERMRLQIKRQQNDIQSLQRLGIPTASAELLLARM